MDRLNKSLDLALRDCAEHDGSFAWRPASMQKLKGLGLTMQIAVVRGLRWKLTEAGHAYLRDYPSTPRRER
jgi:hypothetical protein